MKKYFCLHIFVITSHVLQAQYKLNFGLRTKQDTATLPRSKSAVQFPDRKLQTPPETVLTPVSDREWILSGWLDAGRGQCACQLRKIDF